MEVWGRFRKSEGKLDNEEMCVVGVASFEGSAFLEGFKKGKGEGRGKLEGEGTSKLGAVRRRGGGCRSCTQEAAGVVLLLEENLEGVGVCPRSEEGYGDALLEAADDGAVVAKWRRGYLRIG